MRMTREQAKQKIEQGLKQLHAALAEGRSEELEQYLKTMARFHRYSFNNVMLILMQRPDSSQIAGFGAWKKLGRFVKKGEKGIGIIAPLIGKRKKEDGDVNEDGEKGIFGFKVVYVFDVSQTEGDELPEFARVSGDPGQSIPALEALIRSWGIELLYEEIPGGADGVSKKGTIVIDPGLEPAARLLTLVHEASHERLHVSSERRKETTKTIRETEAEAVAHVVCTALGLDTLKHCADYIHLYNGDVQVLSKSLDYIQKTAAEILDGIAQHQQESNHDACAA